MNIVFFGNPFFASEILKLLLTNNIIPSLIVTNDDKKQGRGLKIFETA